MSKIIVLDCSFVIANLLPDEESHWKNTIGHDMHVPSVFYLECINVLYSALKKKRISNKELTQYLEILEEMPVTVDNFCATPESVQSLFLLASRHKLTSYDASYLELALRLNAALASKDTQLRAACAHYRVKVI